MRDFFPEFESSTESCPTATTADNRRRYDRHLVQGDTPAWLRTNDGEETCCFGLLRDVSLRGVGVTMFRRIEPGTFFLLDAGSGDVSEWVEYRAVRCIPGDSGSYIIGAELIRYAPGKAEGILSALVTK